MKILNISTRKEYQFKMCVCFPNVKISKTRVSFKFLMKNVHDISFNVRHQFVPYKSNAKTLCCLIKILNERHSVRHFDVVTLKTFLIIWLDVVLSIVLHLDHVHPLINHDSLFLKQNLRLVERIYCIQLSLTVHTVHTLNRIRIIWLNVDVRQERLIGPNIKH